MIINVTVIRCGLVPGFWHTLLQRDVQLRGRVVLWEATRLGSNDLLGLLRVRGRVVRGQTLRTRHAATT